MLLARWTIIFALIVPQALVVDLTSTRPPLATPEPKIVGARAGGPIGSSQSKPPVSVRTKLVERSDKGDFLVSFEIYNSTQESLQVPVSLDYAAILNRSENKTIRYRAMLIQLEGESTTLSGMKPVELWGNPALADSLRVLAPKSSLLLKLRVEPLRVGPLNESPIKSRLRVSIRTFDVELSPREGGYFRNSTFLPALRNSSSYLALSDAKP